MIAGLSRGERELMISTMLDRCLKHWPDFTLGVERHARYGHVLIARATARINGEPIELALVIGDPENEEEMFSAKRSVLGACCQTIMDQQEVN